MNPTVFDPFRDRLSRDIRNTLSAALPECISVSSTSPAKQALSHLTPDTLPSVYTDYIHDRLVKYEAALRQMKSAKGDPLTRSVILWDLQLFFEVHEILEHAWMHSSGEEKLLLQALIRAAGVYIKLEAGSREPAARMAQKALTVLEDNRERLEVFMDSDRLLNALANPSLPPPTISLP